MYASTIPTGNLATVAKTKPTWVDYNYLCKVAGNISDYNARHFKSRERWQFNNKGEVNLCSIPAADRETYIIPTDNSKIVELIAILQKEEKAQRLAANQKDIDSQAHELYLQLLAESSKYPEYYNRLKELYKLETEKYTLAAKRWAVYAWMVTNYSRFSNCLEISFAAYSKVFPDHFDDKISLKTYLNRHLIGGEPIEEIVVNKKWWKKVADRRSPLQMAFAHTAYMQGRKIKVAEAHRKLIAYCATIGEKPMSHSNLKIIFREFAKNVDMYKARYGHSEARKKIPYATFLPAGHKNSQWQGDGKTSSFVIQGANGGERWSVFLVQDNHSRKYVGYAIGRTENSELILEALNNAVDNTGVWPYEMIMDKHSFTRTATAAMLIAEIEKRGGTITATTDPQAKAMVERDNQNIDAFWKDFSDNLGGGVKSKSPDARPSEETINEIWGHPANYKTPDEFKALVVYAIEKCNNTPRTTLDGLTPNQKYEQSEDKYSIKISEEERITLFRPVKVYKITRGQITIKVGMVKHEFQLPAHLFEAYNDETVEVRYEDLKTGIYLYNIQNGEYITDLAPKYKIHGAKADQTDEDRRRLNQLAGRKKGTANQARKKQQQIIADTLKNNPEEIDNINYALLTKDIRQEIENDRDLKRAMAVQGVNVNNIPARQRKLPIPPTTQQGGNTAKKQPFTPENHQIRPLTLKDILGTRIEE